MGLAATERCKAYGQAIQINDHRAQIVIPFAFKANEHMPDQGQGVLDNVRYRYFRYLPYHVRKKFIFPIAIPVFVFNKYLGYLHLLVWLLFARKSYDVTFIYEANTFYSFLIRIFTWGKLLIFEMCEIPFFGEKDAAIKLKRRRRRERYNLKLADGFIAISSQLQDYLKQKVFVQNVALVPIMVPEFQTLEESDSMPNQLGLKKKYIVHTGSLTQEKDGILSILRGIALFNNSTRSEKLFFYSTGHLHLSPLAEEIEALITKEQIGDYIKFLGFLSQSDLKRLIEGAQLAVLYKVFNEQNIYCFPSKLALYMNLGVPVIVTDVGPMHEYITHGENGLVVKEGDLGELVNAISLIMNSKHLRTKLVQNSKLTAKENFSVVANAVKVNNFFANL